MAGWFSPEPATHEEIPLAALPVFVEHLRAVQIRSLSTGRSIVATWEPNETFVLETIRELGLNCRSSRASSDHHLERMIVTREDGEAVWAEPRLDQAAWAVVRPVRSAFQFHGSRRSS